MMASLSRFYGFPPEPEALRLRSTLPAVMLAMAAFMAMLGRASGSTLVLRVAGMGIPALAHMAAALALAISNSCSLSEGGQRNRC